MQANPTEGFWDEDDAGTETAHAHSRKCECTHPRTRAQIHARKLVCSDARVYTHMRAHSRTNVCVSNLILLPFCLHQQGSPRQAAPGTHQCLPPGVHGEIHTQIFCTHICLRLPIRSACYFASGYKAGLTFGMSTWCTASFKTLCVQIKLILLVMLQLPFGLPASRFFLQLSFYHSISFSCFS